MRGCFKYCLGLLVLLIPVLLLHGQFAANAINQWSPVADLSTSRAAACSVRLADGRVVVAGGVSQFGAVKTVDVYAPDGSIAAAAPMLEPRASAACVATSDGRLIAIGGNDGTASLASSEIYDPSTDAWTAGPSMAVARAGHTATISPWGAIIIAGGEPTGAVEAYLTNGAFVTLGKLDSPRTGYAVAVVPGHKVLFIGGSEGDAPTASIEMFDADTNRLGTFGSMLTPRKNPGASVLYDGTVLVTGGIDTSGNYLATTEILDPVTGQSTPGPALSAARANHLSLLLPNNGQVLLIGGSGSDGPLASTEVYAPWSGILSATGSMHSPRSAMASSLMRRGGAIVAGGTGENGYLSGAEQYRFATIESGKPDYHPGEIAGFTGSGWKPGEQVLLEVRAFPLDQHNVEFTAAALADSTGQISLSGFNIDRSHVGATFLITASGSQSKAQTSFTDAANATLTTISAPASNANVTYGSLTIAGTVSNLDLPASGVTDGTLTLSVDGLPVTPTVAFGSPLTFSWSDALCASPLACVNGHLTVVPKAHTVAASFTCTAACTGKYQGSSSGTTSFNMVDTVTISNVHPLTPGGDNAFVGGTVNFTATVTGDNGFGDLSAYGASAGTVTFTETGTSPVTAPVTFGPVSVGVGQSTNSLPANIYTTSVAFSPSTGALASGFQSTSASPGTVRIFQANNPASLSISASPASPSVGTTMTFTGTVTGYGTPQIVPVGTITFRLDGIIIANLVPLSSGQASITYSGTGLTGGPHNVWIDYNGPDPNYQGCLGAGIPCHNVAPFTVGKAATTTTVTSTPLSPVNWGQAFTFTSTTTSVSTPLSIGGAVTIQDGGTPIPGCTGIGSIGGVMTCTPSLPFAPGTHTITSIFDPTGTTDPNFATSTSIPYSFTVNPTPTTTTVTASATPVTLGQSITYTAHVTLANSSGNVPPLPGSINFTDGSLAGTSLCSVPSASITTVDSTHFTATCTALYDGSNAAHGVGAHSIFAKYTGGSVTVNTVTGAIAASDNSASPPSIAINPVTVTFGTVAASAASIVYATGGTSLSVPYTLGATVVPTLSQNFQVLDGTSVLSPTLPPGASPMTYSLNPIDKSIGAHSLTVKYPAGDPNFSAATSAPPAIFTVTQATPAFTNFNFSNNVPFGGTVSLAATVGMGNAGTDSPAAPGGTLTFKSGATTLASCTLSGGTCSTTYTGSALAAGVNTITTVYSGDTNYTTISDATHSVTIVKNTLSGTLSTNPPNTAPVGTSVTISTSLTPAGGTGTPSGSVTFYDGSTALSTVTLSGGAASMVTTTLSIGTHTLTISYTGDTNFAPIAQNVVVTTITITNPGGPATNYTVTLSSNLAAPTIAQPVTLTAVVITTAPPPLRGTVQFFDGSTSLGTAVLTGGQAAITVTLAGGGHNLVAVFTTDTGISASSLPFGLYVYRLPCSITASSSQSTVVYGQAAILTAQIAAQPPTGFGPPTGQVQFFDGSTVIGAGTVASGAATISAPNLDAGAHQISAFYVGDNSWNTCKSPAITYTVKPASTTVLASALPDVSVAQPTLTLTANVNVLLPGGGVPTGTVQFLDVTANAVLATAPVTGGTATAVLTQPNAARQIVATYSGNVDFVSSTSPAATEITINNAAAFIPQVAAPDAIMSIFGFNLADSAAAATATPLPSTLGGSTVNIKDSSGAVLPASLFYASPTQINLLVPSATAAGPATVTVTNSKGATASIVTSIAAITPGIFTADFTGKGVAAAQIVRVHSDGTQTLEPVATYDSSTNTAAPVPIDLGKAGDTLYLILYGTGFRHGPGVSGTTVTINGQTQPVLFAGTQPVFLGLDQINTGPLPASFAGSGIVGVQVTVNAQAANPVTIAFK